MTKDYDVEFSEWMQKQMYLQPTCFDRDIIRDNLKALKESFIKRATEYDTPAPTNLVDETESSGL